MKSFFGSFARTYGNVYSIFGILSAALSLFNLYRKTIDLGLSHLFKTLVSYYEQVFHGLVDLALLPWHIELSSTQKDLLVLYLIIGGSFLRAAQVQREADVVFERLQMPYPLRWLLTRPVIFEVWNSYVFFVVRYLFLWPVFVWFVFGNPHAHRMVTSDGQIFIRFSKSPEFPFGEKLDDDDDYQSVKVYDLRTIFFLQTLSSLAAMAGFVAANAGLP